MCEYCDEKGLPFLLCGRACMTFHFERDRCKGCGSVNRPPREWPIFTYCPYCGRNLNENKNQEQQEQQEQEENEYMSKYVWTAEADETIRRMINEGARTVDICDVLGCKGEQLKNHLTVLRKRDPDFPRIDSGTVACADDGAEAVASPAVRQPAVDLSLAGREAEVAPELPADKPEERVPAPTEATGQENLMAHLVKMVEDREIELKVATAELERLREQVEVYAGMIDIKQAKIDEQERAILAMALEIYGG